MGIEGGFYFGVRNRGRGGALGRGDNKYARRGANHLGVEAEIRPERQQLDEADLAHASSRPLYSPHYRDFEAAAALEHVTFALVC